MPLFNRRTKRTDAIEQFASHAQLKFQLKDEYSLIRYFGDFRLFQTGSGRRIRHICRSDPPDSTDEFGIFDYQFTRHAGNSHVTHRQTVYFCIDKKLMLPQFRIFPQRWYHRFGKWLGMQDVNFIVHPDFSRRYILQGPQESFLKMLFDDDRLIGYFNDNRGWSVEAMGYYFIMYRRSRLQKPGELDALVAKGKQLYSLLADRSQQMSAVKLDSE